MLLPLPLLHALPARPCGDSCRFRLCAHSNSSTALPLPVAYRLPPAGLTPPTPTLCLPSGQLRGVLLLGDARVHARGDRRVHAAHDDGGGGKLFVARRVRGGGERSALVRAGEWGGALARELDGRCVEVGVLRYEIAEGAGRVRRVETDGGGRECVGFVVAGGGMEMAVELFWWGGGDVDLAVVVPGGGLLSRWRAEDEGGGRFLGDFVGRCDGDGGRESVVWAQRGKGRFLVQVRRFGECETGGRWVVRVTVGDRVVTQRRGWWRDGAAGELLEEFGFTV